MAESTLSLQLAEFATTSDYDTLPVEVIESVRLRVLDVVGLAVGARDLPSSEAVRGYVADLGGRPESVAIGIGPRLPAASAALMNGTLAHSLDFDDTHLPSVLHPSAAVVPAALAAAEAHGSSGADLVAAIAVGLETCIRLGMAGYDETSGNSTFFEHGQHATSICGAIGGAVAVARLAGLETEQVQSTIGVVASMASGVIEANRTGGTVKRMHCGWAAQSAVAAADFVRRGMTGPPTVLEGRFGFFQAFLRGEYDPTPITRLLGKTWSVPDIFFKPYPANHFLHTTIDAAAELRSRGVSPSVIAGIEVGVPAPVVRTIGEPIEVKRAPETAYQAQFSAPYAVTIGLLGGGGLGASLDDFADSLVTSPSRRELMAKVSVVPNDKCDRIFPHQFPAVLTATLTDGSTQIVEVLANRGGDQWPLTAEEIALKFDLNVAEILPPDEAELVRTTVLGLDSDVEVRQFLDVSKVPHLSRKA